MSQLLERITRPNNFFSSYFPSFWSYQCTLLEQIVLSRTRPVRTEGKCIKSVRFLPHSWDPSQSKRKSRTWSGLHLHSLKQLLWQGIRKFKLPCYLLSPDTWQWCILTLQYRSVLHLKHKYAGISAPQTLLKALRDQEVESGPKIRRLGLLQGRWHSRISSTFYP